MHITYKTWPKGLFLVKTGVQELWAQLPVLSLELASSKAVSGQEVCFYLVSRKTA